MNPRSRTIWITGASSGIGMAVAREIAADGTNLILSGRNVDALATLAEECEEKGSRCYLAPFDLADPQSIVEAAEKALKEHNRIDALYQFGGVSQRSFVSETPIEVDRKIMEINFFGTVLLAKKVLPRMIKQKSGHIAVTSSIVGKFGIPYRSAYSASKHALHGYFECLRAENHRHGIKVSVIVPGRIQTSISVNALNSKGDKYGKMDAGQAHGMTADKAGRIICRGLRKERKEIVLGGKELLMMYFRRYTPWLYYRMAPNVNPL